jgi:hypothetical protein
MRRVVVLVCCAERRLLLNYFKEITFYTILQLTRLKNILRSTTSVKLISFYCHASKDSSKEAIHLILSIPLNLLRPDSLL